MQTELFDRYVHEVGRRLPKKQRADVEAELHSLLLDALLDQSALLERDGEDAEPSEEDQVAVLQEFGPPAEVAAGYRPPNHYLIGPRLFQVYRVVVAAVSGALTLAFAILIVLSVLGVEDTLASFGSSLWGLLRAWFSALMGAFAWVTLIFAALERILPDAAIPTDDEEEGPWDPRTLPQVEDRGRLEVGELVVEVVFTVIALVVFNLFPQWVGLNYWASVDGGLRQWIQVPMLTAEFFALYLPLLNVSWVLRIGLDVVLLRQGRWRRWTRIADFVLVLFSIYILARMVFGPDILTLEGIQIDALREVLTRFVPPLIRLALVLGLIGTVVEAVKKLIRIFKREPDYTEVLARAAK
jgi:hypothetical protein